MHLDVASREIHEIWSHENLYWAIMLNDLQLIATTTEEDNYLIDLTTSNATWISSIESSNLVTAAVKGTTNNARSTTATSGFNPVLTQENDVSFPLPEYDVENFNHCDTFETPKTWFHENGTASGNCKQYCGSTQCKGFAKYVHDVYAHIEGDTLVASNYDRDDADTAWENRTCITRHAPPKEAFPGEVRPDGIDPNLTPLLFDGNVVEIKAFFRDLATGSYVQYGKYHTSLQDHGDPTPANGRHSIVFIASDDDGIWVYECNQEYTPPSTCCGVFIQYYPYDELTKYKFILNYVSHDFSETPVYDSTAYHKVGCDDCAGYVCQAHTNISATIVSTTQHNAAFNCCGGNTATTAHTGTTLKSYYSALQHKVTATCCSGYVLATHTFQMDFSNRSVCTGCGYVKGSLVVAGL